MLSIIPPHIISLILISLITYHYLIEPNYLSVSLHLQFIMTWILYKNALIKYLDVDHVGHI
jgi:hypothetical protein